MKRHKGFARTWAFGVALLLLLATVACDRVVTARSDGPATSWIGTWATAAQPSGPGALRTFENQTLRLIVHTSAGGARQRIRISNTFGDRPLTIGRAHIARRTTGANIDPSTDRALTFQGHSSIHIPPHSTATSDAVDLDVPALSDVAISMFLPERTEATTAHSLALQTNYVAADAGDFTSAESIAVGKTMSSWPFLTGVDIAAPAAGASIVAFGSSTTDGDGSTKDANRRWPDILAERLQPESGRRGELGVLNEGIIGNRLLHDSPTTAGNPFGASLGEAGVQRFDRDVLDQPNVKYVFMCLGVNDILFPGFPFTPSTEAVGSRQIIAGYQQLIARAHKKGVRMFGTTIPPFEGATFEAVGLNVKFYTPDRERVRAAVNAWIRHGGAFDAVVDFDEAVRDPGRPTRLLPKYSADDHLHVNDAGNVAQGNAIPLSLFDRR
ncbi:MAG TPA: SGNH/GDSL hydrolase family protein [Vicinamibacterales bacterium]